MAKFTPNGWGKPAAPQMVPITMLRTIWGAPDAQTKIEYVEGKSYSVPADLADALIRDGFAEASNSLPQGDGKPGGTDTAPEAQTAATRKRRGSAG